ncbi:SET and MYND domain-containing protein 4-like [Plakobranchus ocellatus]|uniref:SET and MYND domain-containing protein 4-like n=1 Tax=Plakobranchus ocellatus TaxID=259542 RepID=A0AAV4CCQ7_9GAST|nr:SET and MYND domain-containing protein 4-like [Plakobranchus ocellatus]
MISPPGPGDLMFTRTNRPLPRGSLVLSKSKLESQLLRVNDLKIETYISERNVSWLPTYFNTCKSWHGKSKVEAAFWKTKGNNFFQQRKFALAVDAYTQSCINAPVSEGEDLTLSLGNRSAALFHLTHYQLCITDIDRALSLNFPPASLHKLLARKTMALVKLDKKTEAVKSLLVLKNFVDSPSFSLKGPKKDIFLKEVDAMELTVENLTERLSVWKNMNQMALKPKVYGGLNKALLQASQCVTMAYTTEKGRHLCATEAIPRGSTLIVEKPFAAVLLPSHYDTHCHHCFSTLPLNCIGCKRCTSVKFCNEVCRDTAWSKYHATECPYLDLLHSVGIAHLSLKIVLCTGLPFLKEFQEHQSKYRLSLEPDSLGLNQKGQYEGDYVTVFDLMTHEDTTEESDMLQYSMTAALLLVTLDHAGFFSARDAYGDSFGSSSFDLSGLVLGEKKSNQSTRDSIDLPSDMSQVGGLLLRHILQLVCNAHAITSIQAEPSAEANVSGTEQTRLATAIYPTASLMNHSCDPTIVSRFVLNILAAPLELHDGKVKTFLLDSVFLETTTTALSLKRSLVVLRIMTLLSTW